VVAGSIVYPTTAAGWVDSVVVAGSGEDEGSRRGKWGPLTCSATLNAGLRELSFRSYGKTLHASVPVGSGPKAYSPITVSAALDQGHFQAGGRDAVVEWCASALSFGVDFCLGRDRERAGSGHGSPPRQDMLRRNARWPAQMWRASATFTFSCSILATTGFESEAWRARWV
jgi:hypothetical protein